jgi:DNA-binding response OmpR family regulator
MSRATFVGIVGHGPEIDRDEGCAHIMRQLGADVRTLDLWDDPSVMFLRDDETARAVIVEAGARPDIGALVLRRVRREPRLAGVGAILAIDHRQVGRLDPSAGFDDFVLSPVVPAELYARVRAVEWKKSEFTTEDRVKLGSIFVDRAAREVTRSGEVMTLTAREFDLLSYLADQRGKVVSRTELLERVWGASYEGGPRTIDIHVRRLRAKLGPELDLVTFRRSGYRLGTPGGGAAVADAEEIE